MSHFVKIAAVQFQTKADERGRPENRDIVIRETSAALDALRYDRPDLVVLSEGIEAVGQTMDQAESLARPGPLLDLYCEKAASLKSHIAGSSKTVKDGRIYNSIVYVSPEGRILGAYHKSNLTIGELEAGLSPGNGAVTLDCRAGRLGGAICFDLNFDWLLQEYAAEKPDIITFSSMYHGGLAQSIWAFKARSFFACAWQFMESCILDPFGRILASTDCYNPAAIATVNLDRAMAHLDYNAEKFKEIKRKYGKKVAIDIPANIGSALIYSLTDKLSAMDVVREFGVELLDDYFQRALKENANRRK